MWCPTLIWGSFQSLFWGLPGDSESKESAYNAGDLHLFPGLERFPGEGNGNPLQYSCLENSMDRKSRQATGHRVTKSRSWTWLRDFHFFFSFSHYFSSVQSLSHVRLFATSWTAARQASLSITNSWSLLKLGSSASVMPANHLILCRPLFLLPSIFPSIRVFSNEALFTSNELLFTEGIYFSNIIGKQTLFYEQFKSINSFLCYYDLSSLRVHQNHMEGFLKHGLLGPALRVS